MNNTGFVYKLVCKDINVTECYVGSTTNTRIRKAHHKHTCNSVNGDRYNYRVYEYIRNNDGFENWELIVLETVQYDQRFELRSRERHHMEALGATLNTQTPNRNRAEWKQNNVEHNNQRHKEYHVDNIEHIHQRANTKHNCECGGKYTNANKVRHEKTKKHQKHIDQN